MNKMVETTHFKRHYKNKKKSPAHLLKRINDGIRELRMSNSPEKLGNHKKWSLAGTLSYKVTSRSRILYRVERSDGVCIVTLLRVCDHKNVYGKD